MKKIHYYFELGLQKLINDNNNVHACLETLHKLTHHEQHYEAGFLRKNTGR